MATSDGPVPNLHLLRKIRVLLVSGDPRFLGLARFLLARKDLVVESTSRLGDVVERIADGVDVVVIDGTGSLTATARAVAEIEAVHPDVGVVVVSDDGHSPSAALRLLPKWGSLAELGNEIRLAYLGLDGRRPPDALGAASS